MKKLLQLILFSLLFSDAFGQANFTYTLDPSSGCAPVTVHFTDQSTGIDTSWNWNFGDGNTSTLQDPVHTYPKGTWTVTLTINGGAASSSIAKQITVYGSPT